MIKITKGLDLPINGAPEQVISDAPAAKTVAVCGPDYVGCKPTMAVKVGDRVKLGQLIFSDKKTEGVHITAPAAGVVKEINRGERRMLLSVVIEVDENEEAVEFTRYSADQLAGLSGDQIAEQLQQSGLWAALRTRPFSRVPAAGTKPSAIFVSAMDTNPLAANPAVIIAEQAEAFSQGLALLGKLTDGKVYLAKAPGSDVPSAEGVVTEEFEGVHPAGNVGTHIHCLDPVSRNKVAWHVGYQDVIAFAKLFTEGRLDVSRVVSLGGPRVNQPRLLRTRLGACLNGLTEGGLIGDNNRMISGSVWNGRTAAGPMAYLSRYANQVSVLEEGNSRDFMGWVVPGSNKFSVLNVFTSFMSNKRFNFTTTTNGSERAMVPVGQFEELMPPEMDVLPTQLMRALVTGDIVLAMQLGCLELDEEDVALCTFACPGKYEYGPILRDNLTRIEKEA